MLTALSSGASFRLAITFALFAALCFVAPPAVLAFGHGENAAHCLSMADTVNHGMTKLSGTAHHGHHSTPDADHSAPSKDQSMTCCGLFCLSALAADIGAVLGERTHSVHLPVREPHRLARGPSRIDRPPIPLAFV